MKLYPDCVLHPDGKGQWLLYADPSCQEVVAFFPDEGDALAAQSLFSGQAVLEEREACARAADEAENRCDGACECPAHGHTVAAIRARK